jgi:chemotaxis protein MotB
VASPVLARRLASIGSYLEAFARAQGKGDAVRVTVGESELVLSLRDTIGFLSGSAELLPAARPILAELRSIVGELPDFGIDVTGHTDDVPIHSALYPSNLELSLARAARVARELSAGTPSLRVRTSAEGFGENRPVASNDDAQGRAQNRRVEIRLVKLG